jgi:hypothetical protein
MFTRDGDGEAVGMTSKGGNGGEDAAVSGWRFSYGFCMCRKCDGGELADYRSVGDLVRELRHPTGQQHALRQHGVGTGMAWQMPWEEAPKGCPGPRVHSGRKHHPNAF